MKKYILDNSLTPQPFIDIGKLDKKLIIHDAANMCIKLIWGFNSLPKYVKAKRVNIWIRKVIKTKQ